MNGLCFGTSGNEELVNISCLLGFSKSFGSQVKKDTFFFLVGEPIDLLHFLGEKSRTRFPIVRDKNTGTKRERQRQKKSKILFSRIGINKK